MRLFLLGFIIFLASCSLNNKKINQDNLEKLKEIIIGDINTQFTNIEYIQHYYMGVNLAINEINSNGGVNGIPITLKATDSYGSFIASYSRIGQLVKKYDVLLLTGALQPNIVLASQKYSEENNIPFINTGSTSENMFNSGHSNKTTFRFIEGIDSHINAILDHMIKSNDVDKFTLVTYSNMEGDAITSSIKNKLISKKSDISIASIIKISENLSLYDELLDNIYNAPSKNILIAIYPSDLRKLVNLLQSSNALKYKNVYALFAGTTEWLDSLGNITPSGWVVTGYPWYSIHTEENIEFYKKYMETYHLQPRYSSYIGYSTYYLIYNALIKANIKYKDLVNNRKLLIKALEDLSITTPLGSITMSKHSHKTNLQTYVGFLYPYNVNYTKGNKKYMSLDVRMRDPYLYQPSTN